MLKRVDDDVRLGVVAGLRARLVVPAGRVRSDNYTLLTWSDVRVLAGHALAEIGAHSVEHPILTRIGGERLDREVLQSKTVLEQHVGRPVTSIAYPNGGPEDYDNRVVQIVKAHGFACACTTLIGTNTALTDLFELRRILVGISGGEPFPFWPAGAPA